ncbi:MAG: hypothetical protein IJL78_10460 [Lachnospiraceae bacterium]|nr:hypothetical protein [Lachnospiraceae bacterium]
MDDPRMLRPCYQCLLRDMDPEAYKKDLAVYIEKIPESAKAGPDLYEKRLKTCTECEKLISGTCMSCGCYVELRAAGKYGRCPEKRW